MGNIKIDMHLGSHDITYERDYNVMGEEVTKEPSKSMEIRTRSYMYVEPTGRIPTAPQDIKIGKMIDIRYYKNTIRIDTTLAVDPDKIEGGKKEYKLNENGIYADINSELCKGNAASIKEQYERMEIPESDLIDYAALQNILGITEIYLSDYARAYDHFCDAIQFTERGNPGRRPFTCPLMPRRTGGF